MTDGEVMTITLAADFLQCSKSYLHKAALAGKVPATRLGNEYRFLRSDLLTWLRSQTTGPAIDSVQRDAQTVELLAALDRRDDDEDLGE